MSHEQRIALPDYGLEFTAKIGNPDVRIDVHSTENDSKRFLHGKLVSVSGIHMPGLYIEKTGGARSPIAAFATFKNREQIPREHKNLLANTIAYLLRNHVFLAVISNDQRSESADKMGEFLRNKGFSVEYPTTPYSGRVISLPENMELAERMFRAAQLFAEKEWLRD